MIGLSSILAVIAAEAPNKSCGHAPFCLPVVDPFGQRWSSALPSHRAGHCGRPYTTGVVSAAALLLLPLSYFAFLCSRTPNYPRFMQPMTSLST